MSIPWSATNYCPRNGLNYIHIIESLNNQKSLLFQSSRALFNS